MRKSGYLSAYPVKRRKTRPQVTRAINFKLKGTPGALRLRCDNGKEFALGTERIALKKAAVAFTLPDPYGVLAARHQ